MYRLRIWQGLTKVEFEISELRDACEIIEKLKPHETEDTLFTVTRIEKENENDI